MRIGQVNASFQRQDRPARDHVEPSEVRASRDMVVFNPEPTPEPAASTVHREAAFLAHLIATREHEPQTRARRRAEPGVAIAAYRDTLDLLTQQGSKPRVLEPA